MMRWVLAILAWLVATAVLGPVSFFVVILLAGPHSSIAAVGDSAARPHHWMGRVLCRPRARGAIGVAPHHVTELAGLTR